MRGVSPARAHSLEDLAGTDKVVCACWCERRYGLVKRDVVRQGRTWSCSHPACQERVA